MPIETLVGRIALAGGQPQRQPRNVLVEERSSRRERGRGRDRLYALVEVAGPAMGRDDLTGRLLQTLREGYYAGRGSVTAGLQQALHRANRLLFEANRDALPGERWTAGLTCAVLRDDSLFIAQAGPAAACLRSAAGVVRIPDGGLGPEESPPLGERHDPEIYFSHHSIRPGDTLLLLESEAADYIPDRAWSDVLAGDTVEEALDRLLAAAQGSDLSALVVRFGRRDVPARAGSQSGAQATPLARAGSQSGAKATLPARAGSQSGAEVGQVENLSNRPVEAGKSDSPLAGLHLGDRLRAAGPAFFAALAGLGAGLWSFFKRMIPSRSEERTVARPSKAKSRRKKRGDRPAGLSPAQKALGGVAVIIPIAVAVLVVVTIITRGHKQRVQADALWQQAQNGWQQAQSAADPAAARAPLNEAAAALDQLLDMQPDHAEAAELRKRVAIRLDEINRVRRVVRIAELNAYPGDADLSRVVVEGTHIFVLDRRNGQVYH
ncbi:MAG TPA: hypothetical protein ENJ31_01890, partial [Anaerolineae bacterium]|nr:hypothetical protein [Anaerolineae bacterium]